jgi:membrane associated rhomboid family serine protease
VVTPTLVVLCLAAFVAAAYADSQGQERELIARFAVIGGEGFTLYRTVTYAFLHGDFLHIGGNMLFLWVFGRPVEDRLGRAGFSGNSTSRVRSHRGWGTPGSRTRRRSARPARSPP